LKLFGASADGGLRFVGAARAMPDPGELGRIWKHLHCNWSGLKRVVMKTTGLTTRERMFS
jgi:hypothetical protein